MKNETVAEMAETELLAMSGGLGSGDAISVGGIAVGVGLCILLTPVGAGLLLCLSAGALGLAGDVYIGYGIANSQ